MISTHVKIGQAASYCTTQNTVHCSAHTFWSCIEVPFTMNSITAHQLMQCELPPNLVTCELLQFNGMNGNKCFFTLFFLELKKKSISQVVLSQHRNIIFMCIIVCILGTFPPLVFSFLVKLLKCTIPSLFPKHQRHYIACCESAGTNSSRAP